MVGLGIKQLGYVLGVIIILQVSYLHPDEHFQSLEILTSMYYDIKGNIAWEFKPQNCARSYVPLILFYGPSLYFLKDILGVENPLIILRSIRLLHYLSFLLLTYFSYKTLLPKSSFNRSKALFFVSTSYVGWSFQSHTFSNSLETLILLYVLATFQIQLQTNNSSKYMISIIQGIMIALGIFNRMTFPAFIFLPSLKVFWQYYLIHYKSFLTLITTILLASSIFVIIDTHLFRSSIYVIAPLNNLLYNMSTTNLETHGLHNRYTHILINLPQLVGPAILYLIPTSKASLVSSLNSLPSLSIYSALILLSIFPHQELRFLIPLMPCVCILMVNCKSRLILKVWVSFNVIMGVILGIFHQSGIIEAINTLQLFKQDNVNIHIWWKTYTPPTWMYMNKNLEISTTNFINNVERIDNINFSKHNNYVIDLKGCDMELLNETIWNFLEKTDSVTLSLFYPQSVQTKVSQVLNNTNLNQKEIFHTIKHLDLDHFDTDDFSTFLPGFSVVEISSSESALNS